MRAVVQRVKSGSVAVGGEVIGRCGQGFVILLGAGQGDSQKEADYLANKIVNLRVFEDSQGKMNLSALDLTPQGEFLVISQFTLYADTRKGRRPSFIQAAPPDVAEPLVEYFVEKIRQNGLKVETGRFGAEMLVQIENDGPVTIIMDTAEVL
ncbi:MAG TPA: D-aminoacyl-tRNA deacylase [Chloroflexia bacterium]|nr:D-aminoacyl-tRNA deacylase [Chloroflexia bacterium]